MSFRFVVLLAAITFISACTSTPRGVSWSADQSCQRQIIDAKTYAVTIANAPGFIEPLLDFTAHQAMQNHGLRPGDDADLTVKMNFELVNLDPPTPRRDGFSEPVAQGKLTRFNTVVHISVVNKANREVWSGRLNRSHAIMGNEIFHTDKAVVAIQKSFNKLLKNMLVSCE